MDSDKLRAKIITVLGIADASKEVQDATLYTVEEIAQMRLAAALPEMLTDEQFAEIEKMRTAGKPEDEIMQWIEDHLPHYDEMIQAIIEDVAEEVASA